MEISLVLPESGEEENWGITVELMRIHWGVMKML